MGVVLMGIYQWVTEGDWRHCRAVGYYDRALWRCHLVRRKVYRDMVNIAIGSARRRV
jgi:hypothetical protein